MEKYEFLGTVIYFDENELVVLLPVVLFTSTFSRRKLKEADLKIGGKVHVKPTKNGFKLKYEFKELEPGQEEILEQIRQTYLRHHKKE